MGYNAYDYGRIEVIIPDGGFGAQWGNDSVCGNDIAIVVLADPIRIESEVMIPRVDVPSAKATLQRCGLWCDESSGRRQWDAPPPRQPERRMYRGYVPILLPVLRENCRVGWRHRRLPRGQRWSRRG